MEVDTGSAPTDSAAGFFAIGAGDDGRSAILDAGFSFITKGIGFPAGNDSNRLRL